MNMSLSLNENPPRGEQKTAETTHNFEYVKELPTILPEPLAKELFMANLGMTKVTNASETLSSSSTRTHSSRQTRQTLREERCNPYGMLHSHLVQVHRRISGALDSERELMQQQLQQPRQEPLHKMILWLMDLPQRFELSRLSFSALRCNECYLCEGVEYPCVRCRQQFHQECHADQGRRQPHRMCPSCTRQTSGSHTDDCV